MSKLAYETYIVPDFDEENGDFGEFMNKIYENRDYIRWEKLKNGKI